MIPINLGFISFSISPILLTISAVIGLIVLGLGLIRNAASDAQYKKRKALLHGGFSTLGTYAVFSIIIAFARSHAVLPESLFMQLDGTMVKITDINQQQPSIVNLWATSCTPCKREMPILEKAERRHSEIAFISLNQRESKETVLKFLQREGLNFRHVLIDTKAEIATNKGVFSLPATLFFDAEGHLLYKHSGEFSEANLQKSIDHYFK